jgi:rhodanese-related sulfurtransferase
MLIFIVMKTMKTLLVASLLLAVLVSCVSKDGVTDNASSTVQSAAVQSGSLPATLSYAELSALLASEDAGILLLDVRTKEEYDQGHIEGALLAPYDVLESMFRETDKHRPIVLYCRSGNRSSIARRTLESMGYTNLSDFGGISRWQGQLVR